jgi:signal recognition particle subunit SRP54
MFKGVEAIIYSMTPDERENPALINTSRRKRIATGAGTTVEEVNKLMKQFEDTRKMMRMMSDKRQMANMMQQMKNMQGMKK